MTGTTQSRPRVCPKPAEEIRGFAVLGAFVALAGVVTGWWVRRWLDAG